MSEPKIKIYTKELFSFNHLRVSAGTNGDKGGDAGKGCRVFLRWENVDESGSFKFRLMDKPFDTSELGIIIEAGGDTELYTLISSLAFALKVLVCKKEGVKFKDMEKIIIKNDDSVKLIYCKKFGEIEAIKNLYDDPIIKGEWQSLLFEED